MNIFTVVRSVFSLNALIYLAILIVLLTALMRCVLPLAHSLFDDDAIVLRDMAREVTLEAPGGARSVTVSFPDMPYLGIWHWPKTDAPYVCIEPWRSLPAHRGETAVLERQADLVHLAPGETYVNRWEIAIR